MRGSLQNAQMLYKLNHTGLIPTYPIWYLQYFFNHISSFYQVQIIRGSYYYRSRNKETTIPPLTST